MQYLSIQLIEKVYKVPTKKCFQKFLVIQAFSISLFPGKGKKQIKTYPQNQN